MRLIILAFLMTIASSAFAYPAVVRVDDSALWLRGACTAAKNGDQTAIGYCDGFIRGVTNTMDQWCVEERVSWGQLQALITAELNMVDKYTLADTKAAGKVKEIISTRWPCD